MQYLIRDGYYQSTLRRWGIADGAVAEATIHWNERRQERLDRIAARKARGTGGTGKGS